MKQQGAHSEDGAGTPDASARPGPARTDSGDTDAHQEHAGPRPDDGHPAPGDGAAARQTDGARPRAEVTAVRETRGTRARGGGSAADGTHRAHKPPAERITCAADDPRAEQVEGDEPLL